MIFNLRGTSGSGKSTVIRKVMESYPYRKAIYQEKRKQPIMYHLYLEEPREGAHPPPHMVILGHYETACGGCDTISDMNTIFKLVRIAAGYAKHVLFEGLLISADVNRCHDLHMEYGGFFQVLALDTSLDLCLASVNMRRAARNPDLPPVKAKNTESKFKGVQQSMVRLNSLGVSCHWVSREGAAAKILEESLLWN